MRVLHLADVHLDTPFAGRSETLRERLRDASRLAFRRAVDLALDEEVHAVLLAGDLFDGERLSFATEGFLLEELGRLSRADIPTVYATGNHDPGKAGRRAQALSWPGGFRVVSGPEPVRVEIRDSRDRPVGRITAAGHEGPRETRDLAASFPAAEGSVPEIALLHAQVVGSRSEEAHEPYAPTEIRTLRRSGYDYWALGHVHLRQRVCTDPPAWYPGNLQGRNPRETGPKGALLVEVAAGGSSDVEFRPLAPVRWEHLTVDELDEVKTLDRLAAAVARRWDRERSGDPGLPGTEWVVRVDLAGPSPLRGELEREEERRTLEAEVAAHLDLLEVEVRIRGLHPAVEPERHLERQDVLGEALRLLREGRTDDELLEALVPDVLAGHAGKGEEATYVRSLLDGLEGELVARMLQSTEASGS